MKAQISIPLAAAIVCGGLIAAQALRNRDLDERLAILRARVSSEITTPEAAPVAEKLPAAANPDRSARADAEPTAPGPPQPAIALAKAVRRAMVCATSWRSAISTTECM